MAISHLYGKLMDINDMCLNIYLSSLSDYIQSIKQTGLQNCRLVDNHIFYFYINFYEVKSVEKSIMAEHIGLSQAHLILTNLSKSETWEGFA